MSDAEFKAWLFAKFGPNPPAVVKIDLGQCPFTIPAVYGTTRESFQALQAHNAKTGVFA